MAYQRLLALPLILLLSGCGNIVYPDAGEDGTTRPIVAKHRVGKDETLYSIAYRYGVEYQTLARWNKIKPPYRIFIGQELTLKPQIYHRVEQGETLYSIAFRYGVELHTLASNNRLKSPYQIFVGDKLTIIPQRIDTPNQTVTPTKKGGVKQRGKREATRRSKSGGSENSNRTVRWGWPARGKIVTSFSPKAHRKGIDIRGNVGDEIIAAAAGDVVYSGNGLLGYGNLIIIRHNSSYLSAYGYNKKLLVKEGVKVQQGERIAEMGRTRKKGAVLHFEIRRDGKPVNPIRYLPRL